MSLLHATRPVRVWVDADLGIADLVEHLNTIPGVRTLYSCQGTIGEGGPHPYPAQIGITWDDYEILKLLLRDFDITHQGPYWGDLHPREQSGVHHEPVPSALEKLGGTGVV